MMIPVVPVSRLSTPAKLTTYQFQNLAEIPPELEWIANLINATPRRTYLHDVRDFQVFAGVCHLGAFRDVTRTDVIAWHSSFPARD